MAINRHVLFGKLNLTLFKSIESAAAFCKLRANPYVELVHWLHQLNQLADSDWQRILRHFEISAETVEHHLSNAIQALPTGASSITDFSHHIETSIERAWVIATLKASEQRIRGASLIIALLQTPELRRVTLQILPSLTRIPADEKWETISEIIHGSPEDHQDAYSRPTNGIGIASDSGDALSSNGKSSLARYCTDLTEQARNGKIDPVIGRNKELRTMIDILLRRRQNNPLLTGEAGVGKTAIVEGLAVAIANNQVPPVLQGSRLLSLDIGAMLAGASVKGEFETRLKGVLEEAAKATNPVILFVDEVHTLVGAGGQTGTGDAANLLKPALARGTLRTIGATTWHEYKRHIETDPALTRRFQVLQVMEPSESATTDMVRGLVKTFANHHKVWVTDEAVRAAVTLSHRYIPARQMPDKAISLLDTACARIALSLHMPPARITYLREQLTASQVELDLLGHLARVGNNTPRLELLTDQIGAKQQELKLLEDRWAQELHLTHTIIAQRLELLRLDDNEDATDFRPTEVQTLKALEHTLHELQDDEPLVQSEVNESVIAAIVAEWTGIPVGEMVKDEIVAIKQLPSLLKRRVIGQEYALQTLAQRIQTARAHLTDPNKPIGVFLLTGPSGVGKTETALAIADALYGGEQNLITVNMSEFQEPHTISTLKGSPPGYVGYGEGGVLTEAVRRRPYSVVLLDEIEKAHPDVHEIFYQAFDKGWIEDGEGRHIDFKNTIILLTSNIGADLIAKKCKESNSIPAPEILRDALQEKLLQVFPAAFLGRLTTIPFYPLNETELSEIVQIRLKKIALRMQSHHGIVLTIATEVVRHIVNQCGMHKTGVRHLISYIEQQILPQLANCWLSATETKRIISGITLGFDANTAQTTYEITYQ